MMVFPSNKKTIHTRRAGRALVVLTVFIAASLFFETRSVSRIAFLPTITTTTSTSLVSKNGTTTTLEENQLQHEGIQASQQYNDEKLKRTSQYQSRRNNSRLLCGAIPPVSPRASYFPLILTPTANASQQQQPSKCRPNAILYLVQKGKHSTYDRNSTALFLKSLDLLVHNYLSIDRHYDKVDVLLFHTGDYTQDDLDGLDRRYHSTVHFKLIDLNQTDYWTIPPSVQHDNRTRWGSYPEFSLGYRHMIRWFALKLYDFVRDYAMQQHMGCRYEYLMRLDEDSYLHSPIRYDLFDFMKAHNYSYAYRMCAYEMEPDVWDDYVDHVQHCHQRPPSLLLPHGTPLRPPLADLCTFYNNFFIVEVDFVLQPKVQHFLQWIDAVGIIYRDRHGDMNIQALAVYAFLPPARIHRFLDWTYEHMTYTLSEFGMMCPYWGSIQAGYLDEQIETTLVRFTIDSRMNRRKCPAIRKLKVFTEGDMSPTYAHLPPTSWFNETFGVQRHQFQWRTIAAGSVESPYKGILSG